MKKVIFTLLLSICLISHAQTTAEQQYAANKFNTVFASENIDTSFRSLFAFYRSQIINPTTQIDTLVTNQSPGKLPEYYAFDGQKKHTTTWLTETQTTGMAVLYDNQLVYEQYWRGNKASSHCMMMSVSKSMASFLIGVAYEEGAIKSLDDQVVRYVPALKGTAYDGVTIKNALEMSSGVEWNEGYGQPGSDIANAIIESDYGSLDAITKRLEKARKPGTYNHYVSMDSHVLGMVLRGATGLSYRDYFEQKLWRKLGAEAPVYMLTDATGESMVFGGANVVLRDMLRFGKLYLHQGRNYRGEQLVSAEWIKSSTTPDAPHLYPMVNNPHSSSTFGYKYQWWTPRYPDKGDYAALGIYGQILYVSPSRKVVIAKTSAYKDYATNGGAMFHESLLAMQAIAQHVEREFNAKNPTHSKDKHHALVN